MEEERSSLVQGVPQSDQYGFYRCASCSRIIPPRKFTQRRIARNDGVLCRCGGKTFRKMASAPWWYELRHLIFHPELVKKTCFWPANWKTLRDGKW